MKKMLFIFNPHTGGGRLKGKLMDILRLFAEEDYEIISHPTRSKGDARAITIQKAEQADILVCCGGDGTLNEVINGLSHCKKPPLLGYIPGGTTNDFANSLRLPRSDMLKAAQRILHPNRIFECDYATFGEDHTFSYVAAFGAFTDVSYSTPQNFKNVFGYSAYILDAITKLPNIQPYQIKITCEDCGADNEEEGEFLFGMISNSTSIGGFSFFDKKTLSMDDGVFEVLLVRRPHNIKELRELSSAILTRNIDSPSIVPMRAGKIKITSPQPIPWTLDGEFGGETTDVTITVQQKGIRICT